MYGKRQETLRRDLKSLDIDSLIVTKLENIFYLCSFSGTTGILLVDTNSSTLIVDPRYTERAAGEAEDTEILKTGNVWKGLLELLKARKIKRAGYEEHAMTLEDYDRLTKKAAAWNLYVELKPTGRPIESLRLIKDKSEIEAIKTACEITSSGFHLIVDFLVEGATERDVASELYCFMHLNGVDKAAFDIIVASGERSAMPHAGLSDRKFKKGDLIVIDMGVCYKGYFSDMTRTFSIGKTDEAKRSMYEAVLKAQTEALERMRLGMTGGECDSLSRTILEEEGYGTDFIHGLGHGVGLEVHEGPALAPNRKEIISEDMVFTVEPGVYKTGLGGVRIEDTVRMVEKGAQVLTDFDKEFLEL